MEDRYLYSVFPKMLIRDLPGVGAFRSQKSLSLSKDEVKYCMKFGSVYRRFANENKTERVTMSNIDRLHNAVYMTEEEYEQYLKANVDSNRGQGTIDITTTETETAAEEETVVEGSEDIVDDTTTEAVEESVESEDEEVFEVEESAEESETTEEATETTSKKSTYQGKKKKH